MSYTTIHQVRYALARNLEAPDGTAAELDDPSIQNQIDAATAEVDGRIGTIYAVPIETPPNLIKEITRDIAAFLCETVFREWREIPANNPIYLRYTRAVNMLKDIAKGLIVLPGIPVAPTPDPDVLTDGDIVEVLPTQSCLFDLQDFYGDPMRVERPYGEWV